MQALLLLLLLLNENIEPYLEYYFTKLKTESEKDSFLNTFKNTVISDFLKTLTSLFINHPFNAPEIQEFLKDKLYFKKGRNYNYPLKRIAEFQRHFYLDAANEFKKSGKSEFYDALIKTNNKSFMYLTSDNKSDIELKFIDLFFESNKDKMNKSDVQKFMFKRFLTAAFNNEEEK